jgi:peptidoglycan/LPS O-acetylase OafA/YrhL
MRGRLENIDGLRGLAALLVLTQHLFEQIDWLASPRIQFAHWPARFLLHYLDLGKIGVVAFFALSGFVVPFSFGNGHGKLGFVIGRFFRLYPAYWVSMLSAVAVIPFVSTTKFTALQILANSTMLQQAFHCVDILPVYWTLFIELLFYGLCLVMYSLDWLSSSRSIAIIFASFLAVAVIGSIVRAELGFALPVGIPLYIAVMLFGTQARRHFIEGVADEGSLLWTMLAALLLVIPIAWFIAYTDISHRESVNADILGFYVAIGLFLLCIMRNAFGTAFLVYAGTISYSIYLFHPIALDLGRYIAVKFQWPISGTIFVLVTLLLTLGVSHACMRLIERPMIRLGRRVTQCLSVASAMRVSIP